MRDSTIKKMLDTWKVEGIDGEQHCHMLLHILETSEIVEKLKDLDYYMCDGDRLPMSVVDASKHINDNAIDLIDAYQYRISQTMRSLANMQAILTDELLECTSIQEDLKHRYRVQW